MMIGTAVESIPRLKPPIMIVADPVSDFPASFWVGLYVSDVKYSVKNPISTPASSPPRIAKVESDKIFAKDKPHQQGTPRPR